MSEESWPVSGEAARLHAGGSEEWSVALPPRRPALSLAHRWTLTVSVSDRSLAAVPRGSVCSPSAFLPLGGAGVQGGQPDAATALGP